MCSLFLGAGQKHDVLGLNRDQPIRPGISDLHVILCPLRFSPVILKRLPLQCRTLIGRFVPGGLSIMTSARVYAGYGKHKQA